MAAKLRNSNKHASRSARHLPMGSGDPDPYIDCWAVSEDGTLFGAWGPIEKGHDRLVETFRRVGGRFKSGALVPENVVAFESDDLAYTVGFEHGEVVIDKGPAAPMTIRVTHIYRRNEGEWRLIHRHADFRPLINAAAQPTGIARH